MNLIRIALSFICFSLFIVPTFAAEQSGYYFQIPYEINQKFPGTAFYLVSSEEYFYWLTANTVQSTPSVRSQPSIEIDGETNTIHKKDNITTSNCIENCPEEDSDLPMKALGLVPLLGIGAATELGSRVWNAMCAVSGTIYVAAIIYYSGKYLYHQVQGDSEFFSWLRFDVNTAIVRGEIIEGYMVGFVAKTGLSEKYSNLGIAVEIGNYEFDSPETYFTNQISNSYWLVGPTINIHRDSIGNSVLTAISFDYELLAGQSNDTQMGTMGALRIDLDFEFKKSMHVGLNIGMVYTELQDIVNDTVREDKYSGTVGISFGYGF